MESKIANLKGVRALILAFAMLIFGSLAMQDMAFGATIGEKEIKAGLKFCAEYPVGISYNDQTISFSAADVPPVIITPVGETNGRTLIPARALFEKMGAKVEWDGVARKVTVTLNGETIVLTIDSDMATVGGKTVKLEVPALIIDHDGDYKGSTMIPVRFVAESLGCEVGWDADKRIVKVKREEKKPEAEKPNTDSEPAFEVPKGGIITKDQLTTATNIKGSTAGGLFPDYDMSYMPLLCEAARGKLIVIDPGHGGKDSGAVGHKDKADQIYEKDINLPVALKLCDLLTNAGAKVHMIRTEDEYSTIYDRAAEANRYNADFYVAIHNNSTENANTKGTMVIYSNKLLYGMNEYGRAITKVDTAKEWAVSGAGITLDENGEPIGTTLMQNYGFTSEEVARSVMPYMLEALGTEKFSIKENNAYVVINSTRMPSMIVEGAFLSNEHDFNLIKQQEYIERYAYGTARGIIEAFNARWGK